MLSLQSALATFDASAELGTTARLAAGSLLAEAVRKELKNEDDDHDNPHHWPSREACLSNTTRQLPIAITDQRPFAFEGVWYPTVQHAFQSQKLPEEEREEAAELSLAQVIKRGRDADLDIDAWDANKNRLMLNLIIVQAKQNEEMLKTLVKYKDKEVIVTDLPDVYWPATLPGIYQKAGRHLYSAILKRKADEDAAESYEEGEEDEESEDEEGEEDEDAEECAAIVRAYKKARA